MNLSSELKKLANSVVYSKTTFSEYYNIGCIKVRISDHMTFCSNCCDLTVFGSKDEKGKRYTYVVIPMVGTFREVQWFTNIKGVIEFIVRFESIARLLIKNSGLVQEQCDKQNVNEQPDNEKVDYCVWKTKFAVMYKEKDGELRSTLEEIYKLSGDKITADKLMSISTLKHSEKVIQLKKLLNNIKNS